MPKFSFIQTSYQNFEDDVLRLRNRNRDNAQVRPYMDWRYLGQEANKKPDIFWVKSANGNLVGMASLIYRPYWMNEELKYFGVLGDISLDKEFRGTGLVDSLFEYIRTYLAAKGPPCSLVIPNVAASKVLSRNGWKIKEPLIHHVFLLEPFDKILSLINNNVLAKFFGVFWKLFSSGRLCLIAKRGLYIKQVSQFDEEFDEFWARFSKKKICIGDRSLKSLMWRYDRAKQKRFAIIKGYRNDALVAYLVYIIDENEKACYVYDILVEEQNDVCSFIKQFIQSLRNNTRVNSVRVLLNEGHPYSSSLIRSGFMKRKGNNLFQIYLPENSKIETDMIVWMLTAADKDV